ncbi:MAG: OmpA family protein [Deltaproteobacteria bacterium]|jgi:outer membrane protein OmpA-like peptidoglycan-associated protein|nr:OmpA family protein [Deltaproteobacteria bacterium]
MLRTTHILFGSTILLASLSQSRPASAEYPSGSLYVGVSGGYNLRLVDWEFGTYVRRDGTAPGQAKSSPIGMLRLGYQIIPRLAIELEGGYLPIQASYDNALNHALKAELNVLFHLLGGGWTPFVLVGGGGYQMYNGSLGMDWDFPAFHGGLGLRGLLASWLALRIEGRGVLSDGFDGKFSRNVEILAGLDLFFSPKVVKKVLDRDGDGLPDEEDRCPGEAGPRTTRGCPDRDRDLVIDSKDKCPDEPGKRELDGCPEKEKDSDGDGVLDSEDKCPDAAGKPELEGCPDGDNDGVPDAEDKCPDLPGLKEHEGCLPEEVAKFTGAIKGITFKTGKADITKKSYPVLDAALQVIQEYPSLRLKIEGHTDNVGKAAKNQTLSEARAEAVKTYLVDKGVDDKRLETAGYGDTQPKESNKTPKGRAANRRIEFTVIQ